MKKEKEIREYLADCKSAIRGCEMVGDTLTAVKYEGIIEGLEFVLSVELIKVSAPEMLEELKRLNKWFTEHLYVSGKPNTENLEYLIAKAEGK